MSKRKIILDTNVLLVSISSKSPYHCIFKKLIDGAYDLGVTTEILMEYEEVIERKFNSEVAKDVIRTLLTLPNVKKVMGLVLIWPNPYKISKNLYKN